MALFLHSFKIRWGKKHAIASINRLNKLGCVQFSVKNDDDDDKIIIQYFYLNKQ